MNCRSSLYGEVVEKQQEHRSNDVPHTYKVRFLFFSFSFKAELYRKTLGNYCKLYGFFPLNSKSTLGLNYI